MKKCLRPACENETDNPKYCSLSCSVKNQKRFRTFHVKQCKRENCDVEFEQPGAVSEKLFCSRTCAAIHNNKLRGAEVNCLNCQAELTYGLKYCSKECGSAYRTKVRVTEWLSGSVLIGPETRLPSWARNYLLEEAGYRCASPACLVPGGWGEINPVTGKTPLTIDHIDGNPSNNRRENLTVLCPNCHSLTPTYGSLNRGSGRKYRREFYKNALYS